MRNSVLALTAAVCLLPSVAGAQATTTSSTQSTTTQSTQTTTSYPFSTGTTKRPTYEFALGYQYLRTGQFCAAYDASDCSSDDPKEFPVGAVLDAVRNWGALGLVGEVGWAQKVEGSDTPFADRLTSDVFHAGVGIRYTFRAGKIWPYAQGLGGVAVSQYDGWVAGNPFTDTRSRPMAQAGGGVGGGGGGGAGGEPPKASDANPPAAIRGTPGESNSAPAQGTTGGITTQSTGAGTPAGINNSTGNMNTKGTGPGTTGTGGPGGSGNR